MMKFVMNSVLKGSFANGIGIDRNRLSPRDDLNEGIKLKSPSVSNLKTDQLEIGQRIARSQPFSSPLNGSSRFRQRADGRTIIGRREFDPLERETLITRLLSRRKPSLFFIPPLDGGTCLPRTDRFTMKEARNFLLSSKVKLFLSINLSFIYGFQ